MAIKIDANIWNAIDKDASVNVYVKKADGNYVKTKNTRYSTNTNLLVSGQKIKIPHENTRLDIILYLPYSAFDLQIGKHENLTIQTQIHLPSTFANDESYQFDLELSNSTSLPIPKDSFLSLPVPNANAAQAEAFLINGYFGCCIPDQVQRVLEARKGSSLDKDGYLLPWGFKGLGIPTRIGNWNNLFAPGDQTMFDNDEEFRIQMLKALSNGNTNAPIILIRHSFGADSLVKVIKCESGQDSECVVRDRRTGQNGEPRQRRKVMFFGAIDTTGSGGFRTKKAIPNNVNYLFNRWTKNPTTIASIIKNFLRNDPSEKNDAIRIAKNILRSTLDIIPFEISLEQNFPTTHTLGKLGIPFGTNIPINAGSSGALTLNRRGDINRRDDQKEQSIARYWNGDPIKESCAWYESCPGKKLPSCDIFKGKCSKGSNGEKQRRVDHGGIATDERVQYEMLQAITQLLSQLPKPEQQPENEQTQPSVCSNEKLGKILIASTFETESTTEQGVNNVVIGGKASQYYIDIEGNIRSGNREGQNIYSSITEFGYDFNKFLNGEYGNEFLAVDLEFNGSIEKIKLVDIPQSCS